MTPDTSRPRSFLDWFFRDPDDGRIVIGQWPNLPLILFAAASAASWLLGRIAAGPPIAGDALRIAAGLCLAWWASDEILRGVNPWRRCLGAAALVFLLWRTWQIATEV